MSLEVIVCSHLWKKEIPVKKMRTLVMLAAVVMVLAPAMSSMAIYVDQCPSQCTPSCPCSLVCNGPFGPTTCGAAGQPCTVYRSDNTDLFSFLQPEQNLTPMQPATDAGAEATVEAPAAAPAS
jgi:hypothetical protein